VKEHRTENSGTDTRGIAPSCIKSALVFIQV
jgi:hypothetical protein